MRPLPRVQPIDPLAGEPDLTRVGPQRVVDQIEQRRLAGAVGPDQTSDGALGYGERGTVDGPDAAEPALQALHLQQWNVGWERRHRLAILGDREGAAGLDPGTDQTGLAASTPPHEQPRGRGQDA